MNKSEVGIWGQIERILDEKIYQPRLAARNAWIKAMSLLNGQEGITFCPDQGAEINIFGIKSLKNFQSYVRYQNADLVIVKLFKPLGSENKLANAYRSDSFYFRTDLGWDVIKVSRFKEGIVKESFANGADLRALSGDLLLQGSR